MVLTANGLYEKNIHHRELKNILEQNAFHNRTEPYVYE